jgi:hypothetical protein
MLASGVVCLVSFVRGGINVGAEGIEGENKGAGVLQQQWRILDRERIGARRSEEDF